MFTGQQIHAAYRQNQDEKGRPRGVEWEALSETARGNYERVAEILSYQVVAAEERERLRNIVEHPDNDLSPNDRELLLRLAGGER